MPGPAPNNAVLAARGLPPQRPSPLHAAFLHVEAILEHLNAAGDSNHSTNAIVLAIRQYVAENGSSLPPNEQQELLRLAGWPSKGIAINDVYVLLDDHHGTGERLPKMEAWLLRLITEEAVSAGRDAGIVAVASAERSEKGSAAATAAARAGLVPVLYWLVEQIGWNTVLPASCYRCKIAFEALRHDRADVLKWLATGPAATHLLHGDGNIHTNNNKNHNVIDDVFVAVMYGSLKVLGWYASRGEIKFSAHQQKIIDVAVANGQLEVLKWLTATWPDAVDFAADNNKAVRIAATRGHEAVLRWLATQPSVNTLCNNLDTLLWVAKNRNFEDVFELMQRHEQQL